MIVGGRNGIHHAGGLGLGRGPARGGQFAGPSIGQSAGQATTANAQTSQILDKDATMTLCMLFLVDKLNMQKVQKVGVFFAKLCQMKEMHFSIIGNFLNA